MPKPNNRCRMCHSPKRGSNLKFIRVGPMTGPREYECEDCHKVTPLTTQELADVSDALFTPCPPDEDDDLWNTFIL